MTRFWLVLNVLFIALVTPAEVHICQAGLYETIMQAKICIDEVTAQTEVPVAAQAVGIYSASMPLILAIVLGLLAIFCLQILHWQPPALIFAVPTPPPRL